MILEVIKENSNIPVGCMFVYNADRDMFESMKRHEEIGEDYEFVVQQNYAFSPTFYAFNEEMFKEIENENSKDNPGETSEEEIEDIQSRIEPCDRDVCGECEQAEALQRKEVEESDCRGEAEGDCIPEERLCETKGDEVCHEGPCEDNGTDRLAELDAKIDRLIEILIEGFSNERQR